MKIVCINNKKQIFQYPLTINKVYDGLDICTIGAKSPDTYTGRYQFYQLEDDTTYVGHYDKYLFITLEEYRIKQIDKIVC